MSSKLRHLAIVTDRPALLSQFYRDLFGMKGNPPSETSAAVVSDGYVGLNVNPRSPGRQGGFDHFGFEVDDVDAVRDRLRESYPAIDLATRPGSRPFAGISTHDPVGNVFDLSQREMANRRDVYTNEISDSPVHVDHVVLRVTEAERAATFYAGVYGLDEMEKAPSDPNHYLTDGRITFIIAPWRIHDYDGAGIERPRARAHRVPRRQHRRVPRSSRDPARTQPRARAEAVEGGARGRGAPAPTRSVPAGAVPDMRPGRRAHRPHRGLGWPVDEPPVGDAQRQRLSVNGAPDSSAISRASASAVTGTSPRRSGSFSKLPASSNRVPSSLITQMV